MTTTGIAIGAFLAFMAAQHGFGGFLLAVIFMAVGAVIGRAATGKLDLRGVGEALIGKSTTTSD
ncbi:hypothetical protein H8R18_06880 [Nanchangia anserum]|uniref:DUF2273 domain-containing protein n=1 Tax=Nanchangia anserum TaxID=2692125 RepID=A0A8I0GFU6_9ACTO|nr:hypothetical protein [Nanchangia anserum]MBD3689254.1 hypothetical protein [Nanchangia anserum]QOX81476.1 hypothetical protein H8R18_06880 [Nanchangia anserum]